MRPKTHRQPNDNKKLRVAKRATARQAIGRLEHNTDTFILTYGQFSLIDAIMEILDQTGPAHVALSTWTAAHAHLDRSAELMESADILSLRMIVDRSFQTRQPQYYAHMISIFGHDCIRAMNTHAKFMVIHNDDWKIVVRTSMNLNENPRLENIEISDNTEFAGFFLSIVDDVFREVAPSENKCDNLKLESLQETEQFKLIQANHIPRRSLKDVRTTHEVANR